MAQQPVINEFVFNHVGADSEEYIEIFADPNMNLSEYTVLVVEGDSGTTTGNVLAAVKLGTTDASGHFVVEFNQDVLQNGTQTILLVKNYTGTASNDLDRDNDGTLDNVRWSEIVDSVAVTDGGTTDKTYSSTVLTPSFDGGASTVGGASRAPDGLDTNTANDWVRNDFDLAGFPGREGTPQLGEAYNTPGAANALVLPPDPVARTIMEVQGTGLRSEFANTRVITTGIVTAIGPDGFFLQDATGDGNNATSDALFVYTGAAPKVQVGDKTTVTGTVTEFVAGGAATGNLSQTQIVASTRYDQVDVLSSGNELPSAVLLGEGGRLPPTESIADGMTFYESLEGMRVTVKELVTVAPSNTRGEVWGVIGTSDEDGVHATGYSDRGTLNIDGGTGDVGTTNITGGDFNPERIQIDDQFLPTPVVHTGATISDITGIMTYDFGNWEIRATEIGEVKASTLEREVSAIKSGDGKLTIASYNVENLDALDPEARFDAIVDQIVNNLNAPDIISLEEVQDNDGPGNAEGSTVTSASETLAKLVAKLEAETGYDYEFVDNPFIGDDTNGGEGGGNIRVAFIYRADRVSLVPNSLATVTDPMDQRTNPDNPFYESRLPLVATFDFQGEAVTVIGNHWASKSGGSLPLYSEGPAANGGEGQRAAQAAAVHAYVEALLKANPAANVVVAGDLNDFENEEPLGVLTGELDLVSYDVPGSQPKDGKAVVAEGTGPVILTNLYDSLPEDERYSYIFDGNSQGIDHMLVTSNLLGSTQFDVVHINAEFYDQISDHDPLLLALDFKKRVIDGGNGADTLTGAAAADTLAGGNGDDILHGLGGADILSGGNGVDRLFGGFGNDRLDGGNGDDVLAGGSGADILIGGKGADAFIFASVSDGGDTIVDFTKGDRIGLSREGFGIDGTVGFVADGVATGAGPTLVYTTATGVLLFDADGAGAGAAVRLAELADGTKLAAGDIWLI